MNKIPFIIGITGTATSPPTASLPCEKKFAKFFVACKHNPHSEIVVLSALVAGADTICAEAALETGCTLIAPLPMEIEEYRKDFDAAEITVFDRLVKSAK